MTPEKVKFVQIAADMNALYGLTAEGEVYMGWPKETNSEWSKIESPNEE